jgi:lipopolysaccharide exporter
MIPANAKLTPRALHALKWRYAGTALQITLQVIVGVVLARLLSPEAFGVVGLALIVIGFGQWLGDLGFGAAIIQYPETTHNHVRAAFTGSVTMGVLLFLALLFLAPTISRMFMQDGLTAILRVTGVIFVFSGMSATPESLLRRQLRFRTLASIEIASYTIGYGLVGIVLAVMGYGVWSLIAANIIRVLCNATLLLCLTEQPLRLYFGLREYQDLFRFAFGDVLNNVTNYMADHLSSLVIGRYLGASSVGLYRRASELVNLHLSQFSIELSRIMFPLYSIIQADAARLRRAHLRTISLTTIFTMPVLLAIAAAPGVVIGSLFGEPWKAAAGTLRILSLSGPFIAITHVLGALSHARGYVFSEWKGQAVYLVVLGVALLFLLPLGLEGVALAVALAIFARYLIFTQLSVKLVGTNWKDFALAHTPGCLLGIAVSTPVFFLSRVIELIEIPDPIRLLMIIVVAILSLVVSISLFPASWFQDLYPWIIDHFGVRLPPLLYKFLVVKMAAFQADTPGQTYTLNESRISDHGTM